MSKHKTTRKQRKAKSVQSLLDFYRANKGLGRMKSYVRKMNKQERSK